MKRPDKLSGIEPYQPVAERAPICLDANESFLPVNAKLLQSAMESVAQLPLHRYPDPTAAALCGQAGAYYGVSPACVTAGNGSDELIGVILSAFLPKGGRLLVCDPDFSMYRFYAALCECEVLSCPRHDHPPMTGRPDLNRLIDKAQTADALILSNPCNPTGQGLDRREMLTLIHSVSCLCIIDEAYMDFWDQSLAGDILEFSRLIVLRTCSKSMGLAGIRLGFALACPNQTNLLRAVKSPFNVNAVTQAIGTALLSRPELLREQARRLRLAKDALFDRLCQWTADKPHWYVTDTKTNFVLLTPPEPQAVHAALLERGISVRLFPDTLRITVGNPEETDALLAALNSYSSHSKTLRIDCEDFCR